MKFSFHNKISINFNNKTYTFYNTLLKNILNKLGSLEKYNQFLAIGDGLNTDSINESYFLSHHIATLPLKYKSMQSDITKGILFARYNFSVSKIEINTNNLTEIGLSSNNENPDLYNFFSLISEEYPNGIDISQANEISFEVTIYLTIFEENNLLLTSGNNPFIEFLLGNGIENIYAFSGSNFNENNRIYREVSDNQNVEPCEINTSINNSELEINISTSLKNQEIDEIVFVSNKRAFARRLLKTINPTINNEATITSQENNVIKINEDIQSINSITNLNNNTTESNYFISKYANDFGDKIHLPFSNLFNYDTPRFVSKDGNYIFFLYNDKVYAYKNHDHTISTLNSSEINDNYIVNIISFGDYFFVISQISPFINTYKISNGYITKVNNNLHEFENLNKIKSALQIDITQCKNNEFLAGIITQEHNALTIYLSYSNDNGFITNGFLENSKEFNYVIAMYKTNFNDGQVIYLKSGDSSATSRIVTHYADKTENDIYSYFAYAITNNSSRIYSKGRAIIAEKNNSNNIVIYYYPQIYEYSLPYFNDNQKFYLSQNVNYLIKQNSNNEFIIYNLIGYSNPEQFQTKISDIVNEETILDIEILNDSILFFTNNKNEKIVAFNLKLNKTQIENLSEANTNYLLNYNKYNKIGSNQTPTLFNLITRITL